MRHVLVKRGFKSGQIMVVLVTGTRDFPKKKDFVATLLKIHPEITTVVQNVNNQKQVWFSETGARYFSATDI